MTAWPHYEDAWTVFEERYAPYNDVLYQMCDTLSGHSQIGRVVAKVGIIDRAFSAGATRHSSGVDALADVIRDNAAEVDALIERVREAAGNGCVYDAERARRVVVEHGKFCSILAEVTRDGRWLPSFASKYLHFHAPGVPIYDSRAAGRIKQADLFPFRGRDIRRFEAPPDSDLRYYRFCNQLLALWEAVSADGLSVNVRRLDQYLLYLDYLGE